MILFYNFLSNYEGKNVYLHMYIPSTKKNRENIIIIISSCIIIEEYICIYTFRYIYL